MDSIKFKYIKLHNYTSHEDTILHFTPGMHLISGRNGSGKSSLFTALEALVSGKTRQGKDPSRDYKGDCNIECSFDVGNDNYTVTRFFGKGSYEHNPLIVKNDIVISDRKKKESQKQLEKIINISGDMLLNIVYVAQGLPVNFIKFTPTLRKKFFEELIGDIVWDSMRETLKQPIRSLEVEYVALKNKLDNSNINITSITSRINTLIELAKKVDTQSSEQLERENFRLNSLTKQYELNRTKLSLILSNKDVNEIKLEKNNIEFSMRELDRQKHQLQNSISLGICNNCRRPWPELVSSSEQKLIEIDSSINKQKEALRKHSNLIGLTNPIVEAMEAQLREINIVNYNIQQLTSKLETKNEDFDTSELERSLEENKKILEELTDKVDSTNLDLINTKWIDSLLVPSSDFRTQTVINYLDRINLLFEDIVPILMMGAHLKLTVTKDGKGIDLELTLDDKPRPIESLSGGELRLIEISIILAFQRFRCQTSGVSSTLLSFDEIFDFIDNEGVDRILTSLELLFPDDICIYIISHNQLIKEKFNSVITLIKENGVSRIR